MAETDPRRPTPVPDPRPLVEGVDYVVEGRRWVFTAAYLLRRGRCCGSGCRHCPYRGTGVPPVAGGTPPAS